MIVDDFDLNDDQLETNKIDFVEVPGQQGYEDFDMSKQREKFNGGGGIPQEPVKPQPLNTPMFIRSDIGEHIPLGEGTKAQAVRVGESGILYKATKKTPESIEETKKLAAELKGEYEVMAQYLGPYVPSTQFVLGDGTEGPTIVALQKEMKDGMTIREALKLADEKGLSTDHIKNLYGKALKMYDDTKRIPDFTAHPDGMAWLKIPGWLRPVRHQM